MSLQALIIILGKFLMLNNGYTSWAKIVSAKRIRMSTHSIVLSSFEVDLSKNISLIPKEPETTPLYYYTYIN